MDAKRRALANIQRLKDRQRKAAGQPPVDWGDIVPKIFKVRAKLLEHFNHPKRKGVTHLKSHCPRPGCGGMIWASINGPKRHLHFACTNAKSGGCFYAMME